MQSGRKSAADRVSVGVRRPWRFGRRYHAWGGLQPRVASWLPPGTADSWRTFGPTVLTDTPVKRFAPNGYGLYDVAGNVWDDEFRGRPQRRATRRSMRAYAWHRKHPRTGPASYQGRFTLVRTFVLPSLPTCGSTRSWRTQHNQSSRISLRASCLVFEAANATRSSP
jgi:formylglycine-generating enzyme required for sulfatase activity